MHPAVADLCEVLELECIEDHLFRGHNETHAGPRVFGGQVLAQALQAAVTTVDARHPHSLHAYFLRPGDSKRSVLYEVDRIRDGGSFTTRRVKAIQRGEAIFSISISFHEAESGLDHQIDMPAWPLPEDLEDDTVVAKRLQGQDANVMPWATRERAFETRSIYPVGTSQPSEPVKPAWIRARSDVGPSPVLHACLLAYASDMGLMSASLVPHMENTPRGHIIGASLDHAMWFHRPFRTDGWLLYTRDSPVAHGGRGFNRGRFFDRDGVLVASVAQESLIRVRRDIE